MVHSSFSWDRRLEKQLIIFFGLSVVIYITFLFWGNINQVSKIILNINPIFIGLGLLTTFLNYFLRFIRFRFFLSKLKIKLNLKLSFLISLAGLAMSVTPGKSGELFKAYFIKEYSSNQKKFSYGAPIIIFERLSDAVGTSILMAWGIWHYQPSRWLLLILVVGFIFFIFLITNQWFIDKLYLVFKKIGFSNKITNHIQTFHQNSQKLLQFKTMLPAAFISLIAWLGEVFTFSIIYYSLTGEYNLHLLAILAFIFTFTSILGFISFLPGGVGVTEVSKIGLLVLINHLSRTKAIAIVLMVRLLTLWAGVFIGSLAFLYLIHLNKISNDSY